MSQLLIGSINSFISSNHVSLIICGCILLLWVLSYICRGYMIYSKNKWVSMIAINLKFRYFFLAVAIIVLNDLMGVDWTEIFNADDALPNKLAIITVVLCICLSIIYFLQQLKKTFMIKNEYINDTFNFSIQNAIVIICGLFLIIAVCVLQIKESNFLAFSICTFILGIVFKDILVGIMAFYHLRSMGLLHIGDWIEIPSKGIEGKIADVSLVSVKIRNFDTTISSIPTASLQTEHLKHNQAMSEGKTAGRRMVKSFLIDIESICQLTCDDFRQISDSLNQIDKDIIAWGCVESPVLNIHLFREYIFHWLCRYQNVSREPTLLVMLKEQTPEGLPLQIKAFITETGLMDFEREQSFIMEHIISTMEIFGLRLFQHSSGNTNNIRIIS